MDPLGVHASDGETQPEALVLVIVGNETVAGAVADGEHRAVDREHQQAGGPGVVVLDGTPCRDARSLAPLRRRIGRELPLHPDRRNSERFREREVRADLGKLIRIEHVEHFFDRRLHAGETIDRHCARGDIRTCHGVLLTWGSAPAGVHHGEREGRGRLLTEHRKFEVRHFWPTSHKRSSL